MNSCSLSLQKVIFLMTYLYAFVILTDLSRVYNKLITAKRIYV